MRARLLRPGFFTDPILGQLPLGAQFLYAGLWCLADREGRLLDSLRMIAGSVFPFRHDVSDFDVDDWIGLLAKHGFIMRYEALGGCYIQIPNFKKHQKIHPNEAHSEIPAPPGESKELQSGEPKELQSGEPKVLQSGEPKVLQSGEPKVLHRSPTHKRKAEAEAEADIKAAKEAEANTESKTPPLTPAHKPGAISQDTMQRAGDLAIAITRRMLCDWMERHADKIPPPDDDLCRRILRAHGMSLESVRDWLLGLRRGGKRPENVHGWGWFVHLADAEAARDGPAEVEYYT